jgi:hypothetical protein
MFKWFDYVAVAIVCVVIVFSTMYMGNKETIKKEDMEKQMFILGAQVYRAQVLLNTDPVDYYLLDSMFIEEVKGFRKEYVEAVKLEFAE